MGEKANHDIVKEEIILITVLRAGIPFYLGIEKVFPDSESGFLGMMRNEETLKAKIDYIAIPPLKGKTIILADTMIATGGSIIDAIKILEKFQPKRIIVVGVIVAVDGIDRILSYDKRIKIFAGAVDPILNNKGYIIPGLGDAGDRSYGEKIN